MFAMKKDLLISFRPTGNFPQALHFLPVIAFKHFPSMLAYSAIITGYFMMLLEPQGGLISAYLVHKKKLIDQSFAEAFLHWLSSNSLLKF